MTDDQQRALNAYLTATTWWEAWRKEGNGYDFQAHMAATEPLYRACRAAGLTQRDIYRAYNDWFDETLELPEEE